MAHPPAPSSLSKLVKAHGVVSERTLIHFLAGEPVRGSWWGHAKSHVIFHALGELREDKDVLLCKLLEGKQTYVHRQRWPALLRLQAEASLWPRLSPKAHALLARVKREGRVRATGRVRLELERSLRVVARSEHTASGAHAVFLTPLESHFSEAHRRAAARLSLQEARAALTPRAEATPQKPKRSLTTSASRGRGTARQSGRR